MRRPEVVEHIRQTLRRVAPSAKGIIYGSEARGDASLDSDIDLLILVEGDRLTLEEEEQIIGPICEIELEAGVLISTRIMLRKLWENLPFKTPFYVNVMNEGIVL